MQKTTISTESCDEHSVVDRVLAYRIPHYWKTIGLVGGVSIFIFLLFYKFYGSNTLLVKDVCRTLVLFFLLLASLSREKVEDEYVRHVRSQSYVAAFTCALVYSISIPLIAIILDVLITKITGDGSPSFYDISGFEVMFTLIGFQLLFFEALKLFGRAE